MQKINIALSASLEEKQEAYTGDSGLYMHATPDDAGKYRILELCEQLSIEGVDAKSLHCTLMYSRNKAPDISDIPQSNLMSILITEVKHWVGHDDRTYIVAGVTSTDVQWMHANLVRAGAEPSFVPYLPHITLMAGSPVDEKMQKQIDKVNKVLNRDPINMTLEKQPPSNISE